MYRSSLAAAGSEKPFGRPGVLSFSARMHAGAVFQGSFLLNHVESRGSRVAELAGEPNQHQIFYEILGFSADISPVKSGFSVRTLEDRAPHWKMPLKPRKRLADARPEALLGGFQGRWRRKGPSAVSAVRERLGSTSSLTWWRAGLTKRHRGSGAVDVAMDHLLEKAPRREESELLRLREQAGRS